MNKFDIGTFVVVNKQTVRTIRGSNVDWVDLPSKSFLGRVVGLCRRNSGTLNSGSSSIYYEDYEQGYLSVSKSNLFYKIIRGWLNKPIFVKAENMCIAKSEDIEDFPLLFTRHIEWNEQSKDDMRKEVADWPRDENGK